MNTEEARELQLSLSHRIVCTNCGLSPQVIAGVDVSVSRFSTLGRAAVVVLSYPGMEVIDLAVAEDKIIFPYVPGLLSFREIPVIMKAWKKLATHPDLIIVDGQGIAHPRRFGIASHLGLLLDTPSIGCAKSRLVGDYVPVPQRAGSYSQLLDGKELIGAVLRTRQNVKPVFVSIGHKMTLPDCISWVLKCCRGMRLPEPTRLAHIAAGQGNIIAGNLHSYTRQSTPG